MSTLNPYNPWVPVTNHGTLMQKTTITTRDGLCPTFIHTPKGEGPWPAIIFFMDGFGVRQTMHDMATRLSDHGYLVLLPDLFYRLENFEVMDPSEVGRNPELRQKLLDNVASLSRENKVSDAKALIDHLSTRSDVRGDRFGSVGYCMGGNAALTAAGAFPDRFSVAASFHGGRLATDQSDSPHLFFKNMSGFVYVAGAVEDNSFPEEQKIRLEKTLSDAGVPHLVETYSGARHGFAVPDSPVFDLNAAERHWKTLFTLFDEKLKE